MRFYAILRSMTTQLPGKLNKLRRDLPEGLLVDAAWLSKHGYATSLVSKYVAAGYLERPAGRVYRKPRGALSWEQAVISLQTLLYRTPLAVGGRTALALQGYEHYLPRATQQVHLFGPSAPPVGSRSFPSPSASSSTTALSSSRRKRACRPKAISTAPTPRPRRKRPKRASSSSHGGNGAGRWWFHRRSGRCSKYSTSFPITRASRPWTSWSRAFRP
ncbi:AbiEi antitoxin N-terminal domain-containing protein [Bradyrhizobium sp. DASA03120]|uniref:AbiEi antitoxin N-terminal domain-containing protein n=1 Tax=Bradyrhizobium sp. SMVTL-02 TaxID=3395917 RepID=UPI003F723171